MAYLKAHQHLSSLQSHFRLLALSGGLVTSQQIYVGFLGSGGGGMLNVVPISMKNYQTITSNGEFERTSAAKFIANTFSVIETAW